MIKRIFIITMFSLLVAVTVWRFTRPALLRMRTNITPGSPHLLILNPIRSGQANSVAHSLLEFLRTGDVTGAAKRFPMIGKNVLEDNSLPLIRRWILDDVVADPEGGLNFEYLYSDASGRTGGYIWVYCIKEADGVWTVRTFNRVS